MESVARRLLLVHLCHYKPDGMSRVHLVCGHNRPIRFPERLLSQTKRASASSFVRHPNAIRFRRHVDTAICAPNSKRDELRQSLIPIAASWRNLLRRLDGNGTSRLILKLKSRFEETSPDAAGKRGPYKQRCCMFSVD